VDLRYGYSKRSEKGLGLIFLTAADRHGVKGWGFMILGEMSEECTGSHF